VLASLLGSGEVVERALTDELWASIEDVYAAILAHPFIAGLTDGSLDRHAFQFYVVQDAHYLREFARALSITAARAPAEDEILLFSRHAAAALEVERSLHASFFQEFGLSADQVAGTPLAPTTVAYTSYLLAVCHAGSFPEALAALLPCYWIYWEVGKTLLATGSPDPLYQRWIDTYGDEEFAAIATDVLALTNRIGGDVGLADRERMNQHFHTSSRYEWMFWEMGYRQEAWPI
jgi:thiaminase/transcriptional activator TenA